MVLHRTAQRLQGLLPALQGQNKLQQNNSQELSLTDFEGSRFDRWLRQGSGQHPLTGSPQHQWGFLVSGKPGNRLTRAVKSSYNWLCFPLGITARLSGRWPCLNCVWPLSPARFLKRRGGSHSVHSTSFPLLLLLPRMLAPRFTSNPPQVPDKQKALARQKSFIHYLQGLCIPGLIRPWPHTVSYAYFLYSK